MSEEEQPGAEVVSLFAKPGEQPVESGPRNYCRHLAVRLDGDARRVYCRECGREVDPFTYLEELARDWERHASGVKELRRQERVLEERVTELKRERTNAQAALRRARAKLSRYGEAS